MSLRTLRSRGFATLVTVAGLSASIAASPASARCFNMEAPPPGATYPVGFALALPDVTIHIQQFQDGLFNWAGPAHDANIVVSNIDDRPTVLENRTSGRWVEVRLRGVRSNRSAIGARVVLGVAGRRQERTIQSGMSWASQCELSARFGLGEAVSTDSLRVVWPGGLVESFPSPRAGQVVTLVEGSGDSP